MISKTIILLFLFASGCVIGWIIELFYRRFKKANKERIWINPGFLNGPYLPLYGFGLTALYLLALTEQFFHFENPTLQKIVLFLFMSLAMTVIELIAGEIFIIRMNIKLWDYSENRFNYKGIICPRFSFYWTVLGAVYYFLVHPHILRALDWFSRNPLFSFVIGFYFGIMFIDLATTFNAVGRIKKFAKENAMIIRYEELKMHIKVYAIEQKEKYRFLHAFHTDKTDFSEHLRNYFEKQIHLLENNSFNDFIDEKLDEIQEKIEHFKDSIHH